MKPALRAFARALVVAGAAAAAPASAQDAAAGKSLYKTYCQVCHTVDPSTAVAPFNRIMNAANDPAAVAAAAAVDPSQMGFITSVLTAQNRADIAAYLGTFVATPPAVAVVEFHHATRDHYFVTAAAAEIADLDSGVHQGWARTGLSFRAWPAATGGSPVCRFYLPPDDGDSHFYSASPVECDDVRARFPRFVFESSSVFHIGLPEAVTGACAAGTAPVYRVWSNRPDANHRYTTSAAIRAEMVAAGWVAEGYGPDLVIMCAPQ